VDEKEKTLVYDIIDQKVESAGIIHSFTAIDVEGVLMKYFVY